MILRFWSCDEDKVVTGETIWRFRRETSARFVAISSESRCRCYETRSFQRGALPWTNVGGHFREYSALVNFRQVETSRDDRQWAILIARQPALINRPRDKPRRYRTSRSMRVRGTAFFAWRRAFDPWNSLIFRLTYVSHEEYRR